jgi:hypothetical protein
MKKNNYFKEKIQIMRNPFISITLAFIALCMTIDVAAQSNKTSVSVGIGQFFNNKISGSYSFTFLKTSSTQQTSQFTPVFAIKLEKRFWKNVSLGLEYNSLTAKSERANQISGAPFVATTSQEKVDTKISGISANLKYFVYSNTALDAYIGTNLGFLNATENVDKILTIVNSNPLEQQSSQFTQRTITALLKANLGVRYFVTKKWNIYGEIGATRVYHLDGAAFQGGVIYRF